jgi:LuxR family maltose regulon positive regulatory protein
LTSDRAQREIGRELYLSLKTIKSHTRSIFRKLGASSREEAVARARELELI